MNEILSWPEIEERYNGEWVQLVDYDWPEGKPYPNAGHVRIHATTRKEFNRLVKQAAPVDAARLFVGKIKFDEGVIFSANAIKITACN